MDGAGAFCGDRRDEILEKQGFGEYSNGFFCKGNEKNFKKNWKK